MKTWLITGASSGLGRLMCESLLARGDRVVASVRREGALEDMRAHYGEQLQVIMLDISKTDTIKPIIEAAFANAGRIDVVVSNAGYGLLGAAEELSDSQIKRQIATNLIGSIQLIRAAIPLLRQQSGGRIVQLSSEGGQIAYPDFSVYHATKWGIEGFVEAVRQEVAAFGIDFLLVEPGPTATTFAAGLDIADALPVYNDTDAGNLRNALTRGEFAIKGDARKCVAAIIAAADAANPPLRLPLGSTAYQNIETALSQRLDALRAMKNVAYSADRQ
ncbi:Dehydrogenases with different specificities (related to short-chain alcohol dehydrogenases) [Cronobacter dublinensis 1210]|uniref:Dehydrogenases with different specificities (Related to short-chain alcohol dehydrogenases) n=1 Tax=Cronobacter dublinensis 1210 TaxID=1208656 RepID=A0ABM9QD27_9ENTR|nr:SDR family oxidoreductase [Cronobacter dublinensis]ALB68870.1 short-chain dehydrogenase [Cronobacter dublinensis subsp. dublinensis LMG 23823]MDI7270408.1 SDR family oxidoreductase [Cronobacter dublinensis]CCJ83539.1 Dehydrogenases with different specificities (related to short-chain alcohol dehydrogenases) [Cronobacter dublinensis 1210]